MAESTHDAVLDAALNEIGGNCNLMIACSGIPTNRAEAIANALAQQAMVPGDFPISDGVSGREIDVAAKNGVTIDAGETFAHVAYVDGTRLLHLKPGTSQVLTAGGTVNFPTTKIRINDPVAV